MGNERVEKVNYIYFRFKNKCKVRYAFDLLR